MSFSITDDEYLLRWVDGGVSRSGRSEIYLFRREDVACSKSFTTRSGTYRKLKPVLDLMTPLRDSHMDKGKIKNYLMTKDEFEAITGKRP